MPCAAFCVVVFFAATRNAGLLIGVLGGGGCLGLPFFTLPLFPLCPAIRMPMEYIPNTLQGEALSPIK